jgi:selenocysteine-specific elongation factor
MRVVSTAGHVDHGKSSLVLALTGTDPDRFPEEKARGLTIDLGFAFCTLPSGREVGFVDVPGHVKFVKNMLAGVGAVDVAMLVVAANEGWMPQTEEHWSILELLGITHGLVALTKVGIADDETRELTRLHIEERTDWPIIDVDSVTGVGIDDVARTLDDVLLAAPPPRDVGRPRLWVDRVFAAKGAGTVVTGTLTGGALAHDADIVVEPGGRRARVRGIESHHARLATAEPGSRVALNLAGVDYYDVARGDAVVRAGAWAVVSTVDIALHALPGFAFPTRGRVDVHAGSGELSGRLRILDGDIARLVLDRPLPLAPGDRLVIRSSGAQSTLGGATVLDVSPPRRTADAVARARLSLSDRVLAAVPWCTADEYARLAGALPPADATRIGEWIVTAAELERVRTRAAELSRDGWPPITSMAAACGVTVPQLRAALGDQVPESPLDDPAASALLAALDAQPFAPPAPSELGADPALVRALVRAGALVDLDGILFSASAIDAARSLIATAVVEKGEVTIGDLRDLLGSTRKYVLPIVNRMDAEGVTRRAGDLRTPGPRAQSGPL